jgi:hypothetical protein
MLLRRLFRAVMVVAFILGTFSLAQASDEDLKKELAILKQKVSELETKLDQVGAQKEGEDKQTAKVKTKQAADENKEGTEEYKPHLLEIKEELREVVKDKWGLEFHGGAVAYYQGSPSVRVEREDISGASGGGGVADLSLAWRPAIPLLQGGRFFIRGHVGEGQGADKDLGGRLFANLNTIADDNVDDAFRLLEAYYAQEFFGKKLIVAVGKTEPFVFVDNNAFANNENSQFVGKPFVNNPVFNSEDEYGPIVAATFSPNETFSFTVLYSSSSRPNAPEANQKNIFDDITDTPLVAGQFTYSPKFGDRQGNYRVYVWDATYDHSVSTERNHVDGWGAGVSFDQQVTDVIGLFARFGYSNADAYDVDWFWSAGASLKGLIPSRGDDVLGIGVAGLKGHADSRHDDMEFHTEAYYRIYLTENFAISPDIQYVANPLGTTSNDGVFAAMVRGEFTF